jgi:hypothetical protein
VGEAHQRSSQLDGDTGPALTSDAALAFAESLRQLETLMPSLSYEALA